jgi:hypothetical protein
VIAVDWPNGLGWDVGRAGEIWKFPDGSRGVRVAVGDRYRSLRVSPTDSDAGDPIAMVARCRRYGAWIS